MIDVGMDLGSTYTIISICRKDTGCMETLNMGMASACIPSVAALDKDRFKCGVPAKVCIGKKDVRFFNSFKMLLTENTAESSQSFGFDKLYTPAKIAYTYIEEVLKQVLVYCHAHVIENLVMTVPELWYENNSGADGRKILHQICSEMKFVRHVQLISEPVAAGISFARNFQTVTGEAFDGHMLIIDYGGKNLSLTLMKIGGANDDKKMPAEVLEHTEAGENVGGRGDLAGTAYIEKLMLQAVAESEMAGNVDQYDSRFLYAVSELEETLQKKSECIEDVFEEYGTDDTDDLDCLEFCEVKYGDTDIKVTYGQMLRVYRAAIAPLLKEKMDEMIYMMKIHNVNYGDRRSHQFKIAVTGGFGSFYLVQKQIRDQFEWSSYDRRQDGLISEKKDDVYAVSRGAALVASEAAVIPKNAPYGLGVLAYNEAKDQRNCYAIRFNQPLIYNKVYYARDKRGEPYVMHVPSGSLEYFLVNFEEDYRHGFSAVIKQPFLSRLEHIVDNAARTAVIGISVDPAGMISLHIHDYDIFKNDMAPKAKVVELACFEDLFEMTAKTKGGDKA